MTVEINLKIFLLAILFLILNRFEIYLIFIISIFLHELAHLFVGIFIGLKPEKIIINPLGISMNFHTYGTKKIWKKILIYLAGPSLNFLLAILFSFINLTIDVKEKIILTNLLLGIFNLIPLTTLDGGKILREIFIKKINVKNANIISVKISKVILILITLLYSFAIIKLKNIAIFMIIIYLWYLQYIEEKKSDLVTRTYEAIEKNKISDKIELRV